MQPRPGPHCTELHYLCRVVVGCPRFPCQQFSILKVTLEWLISISLSERLHFFQFSSSHDFLFMIINQKDKSKLFMWKPGCPTTLPFWLLSCGILCCSKAREEDVKCTVVIFTIIELNTTQSSFFYFLQCAEKFIKHQEKGTTFTLKSPS